MSANTLTTAVINYLQLSGFKAWRNQSAGLWDPTKKVFRKNPNQLKGTSDILGFCKKTGTFIGVEVKYGKDKLSPEQILFLEDVKNAGGIALVAKDIDSFKSDLEQIIKKIN